MHDSQQTDIPPSFVRLYSAASGQRLTLPAAEVRARYELCEDLAQMLTTQAPDRRFELGVTELDVLHKMLQALAVEGSPVRGDEARWVVRRLAELLAWPDPGEQED